MRTGQAEMLELKETMRLKLLVDPPERKAWSQPQNLSKDKQVFEAKSTHSDPSINNA